MSADRILERLRLCGEAIEERPYSHPVTVDWYVEDVDYLCLRLQRERQLSKDLWNFLVELVDDEWGGATGMSRPYTGSFEPMNELLERLAAA